MSDDFIKSAQPLQPEAEAFNTADQLRDLRDSHESLNSVVMRQGAVIAEHQGNIKGVFPAISAVQSSLAAWLTIVGIVATILFGLAVFNLTRTNSVGDRVDTLSTNVTGRLGALEVKAGNVDERLSVLPQQVAHELRQQDSDAAPAKKKP